MRRSLRYVHSLLAGLLLLPGVLLESAAADPGGDGRGSGSEVAGSPGTRGFEVAGKTYEEAHENDVAPEGEASQVRQAITYVYEPGCDVSPHGSDGCVEMVCTGGRTWMARYPVVEGIKDLSRGEYFCADPAAAKSVIGSSQVLREIKRIGLPASRLSVQPPGGKSLVNFDTIFSTTADEIRRPIRVAGIRVAVHIWPSAYTWRWGDETQPVTTDDPGRAYERGRTMDSYLTHQYVDAGVQVAPRVDVTYAAEFRVRGGAWQPVDGTVTIEGTEASLRIVEARPVLVGSD